MTNDHPPPSVPSPWPARGARAGWGLVALILVVQYALFRGFIEREVAWTYPARWDQAVYLTHAYAAHAAWEGGGMPAALATAWSRRLPQTALLPIEAAGLMRLLGASRLTALTLVFLHFVLLQVLLVAALRRLAPGWSVPALALGLLWALRSPAWWGGLSDFRLDFMATCLQGAWVGLALRCDSLARPGGAALAAGMAAWAGLLRYLTLAHTWVTLVAFALLETTLGSGTLRRARVRGAVLVLGVATLAAGVPLSLDHEQVRAYYWSTAFKTGTRLAEWAGVATPAQAWLFYPRSLRDHHLGRTFVVLGALTLLGTGAAWRASRRAAPPSTAPVGPDLAAGARLTTSAVLAPLVLLTAFPSKSDVVASIVLPALTLLLVLPAAALMRRGVRVPLLSALAACVLLAGFAHHVAWLRGLDPLRGERSDSRGIVRLHLAVARVSLARGWREPLALVDSAQDHATPWVTSALSYERFGALVEPRLPLVPAPWRAVSERELLAALARAQIVAVTRGSGPWRPPRAVYDRSMQALRPLLRSVCEREFERLGRFRLRGREVLLFVRPERRAAAR